MKLALGGDQVICQDVRATEHLNAILQHIV